MDEDFHPALPDALDALANPVRLRMIRAVRTPRVLSEIEVDGRAAGDDRPVNLSRQAVRWHLDRLLATGFVLDRPSRRAFGDAREYVLSHQRIYSLAEEIRGLARMRASVEPVVETVPASPRAVSVKKGPRLVLVRGLEDGTTYDLSPPKTLWTIGRAREADVPLDFDSAVSAENATLRWDGTRHLLEDVLGSRNGTYHNFHRVDPARPVPLAHGDVVGVGRSLLLYWT